MGESSVYGLPGQHGYGFSILQSSEFFFRVSANQLYAVAEATFLGTVAATKDVVFAPNVILVAPIIFTSAIIVTSAAA